MKRKWLLTLVIIGVLRFIAPLLLIVNPIGMYLFTSFLDIVDGQVSYEAGLNWRQYTIYDKLLDYWLYIGILVFCYPLPIFPLIFILFILRSIGQFLVLFTRKENYFLYFPNVLERFFAFYLLSLVYQPVAYLFIGSNQLIPLIISIFITLPHEYLFHVKGPFHSGRFKGRLNNKKL